MGLVWSGKGRRDRPFYKEKLYHGRSETGGTMKEASFNIFHPGTEETREKTAGTYISQSPNAAGRQVLLSAEWRMTQ